MERKTYTSIHNHETTFLNAWLLATYTKNYLSSRWQFSTTSFGILCSLWAGNDANRLINDNGSSKSLRASANAGYLSFTKWSKLYLGVFYLNLLAFNFCPLATALFIFLMWAFLSLNFSRMVSCYALWISQYIKIIDIFAMIICFICLSELLRRVTRVYSLQDAQTTEIF